MNPYSESQKPEFCPVKNTDTIVIFIHGIVEGPAQFKDLMKLTIQHGYSAVSLLLPGHGGTGKDFARSSGDQWIDYTRTQINLYKQQYDKIILVGHSMRTLLSFIAYAENPGQITGIVAIDSPLHVSVKWLAIKNNLKIGFSKKISENDPAQALLHASSVAPCSLFTYLTWAPRIIDLFRLMKQTRELLHCVAVPTLVIHADKDELVSSSSVRVFQRTISTKYLQLIRLPESTHFVYGEEDLKTCHKAYCDFLNSRSTACSLSIPPQKKTV